MEPWVDRTGNNICSDVRQQRVFDVRCDCKRWEIKRGMNVNGNEERFWTPVALNLERRRCVFLQAEATALPS